jgi:hypothetical protein
MKLSFPVATPRASAYRGPFRKKRFAPWETVFDEMFLLWFGIDFPSRTTTRDDVLGGNQ